MRTSSKTAGETGEWAAKEEPLQTLEPRPPRRLVRSAQALGHGGGEVAGTKRKDREGEGQSRGRS